MAHKKLSDLKQIDGKIRQEEEQKNPKYEITSLDQLFGDNGFSKYNTMDLDDYKNQLSEMNISDLHRHCTEVAHVIPSTSRERTEKRLILEFQKHVSNYTVPKITPVKERAPSKEALKIMSEVK